MSRSSLDALRDLLGSVGVCGSCSETGATSLKLKGCPDFDSCCAAGRVGCMSADGRYSTQPVASQETKNNDRVQNEGEAQLCVELSLEERKDALIARRAELFAKNLSVSYSNVKPLWIVRGEGQYLIDETGQKYLDTRNNVPHVGHAHPRVAASIARQASLLNTNTRYLHENMVLLAERILAYSNLRYDIAPDGLSSKVILPSPGDGRKKFSKVFFVNSGSEANDLAMRLAETYTGRKDFVSVQHGYHGHTRSVVDISPYKFVRQQAYIEVIPQPEPLSPGRGGTPYSPQRSPANSRNADVIDAAAPQATTENCISLRKLTQACSRRSFAAMFIESGMSVGGAVTLPNGYLDACAEVLQDRNGGILVLDEVQVGFGRYGTSFWGWQSQMSPEGGRAPDIITCGKPMGNGMPLACVITTKEIGECLGKEYFNTFGGNPVCCAAGIAVLDVLEEENLMARAIEIGAYLRKVMREKLGSKDKIIAAAREQVLSQASCRRRVHVDVENVNDKLDVILEKNDSKLWSAAPTMEVVVVRSSDSLSTVPGPASSASSSAENDHLPTSPSFASLTAFSNTTMPLGGNFNHNIGGAAVKLNGDVVILKEARGSGLFNGLEFIVENDGRPATAATSFICQHMMRHYKILTSIDGPNDNILVVKPPMVFTKENCDTFAEALFETLVDIAAGQTAVQNKPCPRRWFVKLKDLAGNIKKSRARV
ncbi:unnamed protein product [Amoebophrya sp. A25]|nr:unnamed protein product [Amoebophrya sp. A25]|eukprot:GSA25T00007693001.1